MAAPPIKIRIGAAVDPSLEAAFNTAERRQQKLAQNGAREAQKAARAQARAAEQAAEGQARAQDMVARRGRKAADDWARSLAMIGRIAEREMMRQARAMDRADRTAGRNFAQRVSHRTTRFLTPNAPLGSMASQTARDIARGLGVDFSLGGGIQRGRDLEQASTDLSNAGFMRGRSGPAGMRQDPRAIREQVRQQAIDAGVSSGDAVSGLQAFVGKTGDLATGRAVLGEMAKLSKATGANLNNMVDAAGDVGAAFGDIATSQEEADARAVKIAQVMRVIAGQGKEGAVEVKQLASQMAKVSTSATAFAGDKSQNIGTMGALAQMARQRGGAATANIAATSVASFVNTLRTPARRKAFEGAGVQLEAGGGKFRDPQEIIIDAIKAAGDDTGKFKSMFANVQGARAVEGFRQVFLEAGGGATGENAVRSKFKELGAGAAITEQEQAESLAKALSTTSSKAQIFQERLDQITDQAAGELLPALEEAGPALLKFAKTVSMITTWVVENPKTAIAGAISAAIARAGLESVLRSGIERMILGAGDANAGKLGKLAGGVGAAGTIVALAVTTLVVGTAIIDHFANKEAQERSRRVTSNAEALSGDLSVQRMMKQANGLEGPEREKVLQAAAARQAAIVKERERNLAATEDAQPGFGSKLIEGLTPSFLFGENPKEALKTREQADSRMLADQKAELAASRASLQAINSLLSGTINVRIEGGLPGREEQ